MRYFHVFYIDTNVVHRVKFPFSTRCSFLSGPALTLSCTGSDDCAEVRRKIRLLQKTPGWKVRFNEPT